MRSNVPKVGQAFKYPLFLKKDGVILADPDLAAYVSGDITAYFGTSTTEVVLTCTQRGTTPILDLTISSLQHSGSPVLIRVEDRNGTTFDDDWFLLFTDPKLQISFDGDYQRLLNPAGAVLAHAVAENVAGVTIAKEWIDGDVPP